MSFNKKMRLAVFGLLALVLVAIPVLSACGKESPTPTPAPTLKPPPAGATIKFGALFDLSGPSATFHVPIQKGYLDYWKYVNEVEGGINGVKVEPLFADTQYKSDLIQSSYKSFVDQDVKVVFSNLSLANDMLKDQLAKDQIPMTTPTGTLRTWWPVGWIYGPAPVYAEQTSLVLDFIKKTWTGTGAPKVALLMPEAPYGHEPAEAIPYGKSIGLEFVGEEYHPGVPTTANLEPTLLKLKNAGADWIISFGMGHILTPIAQVLDKMNWHPKVAGLQDPFEGMGATSKAKPEMAPLFEGFYGTMYTSPSGPYFTEDNPGNKLLFDMWKKYQDPNATVIGQALYRSMIPNSLIVKESIKRTLAAVGWDGLTGANIKKYGLDTISDFSTMGLLAPVTFNDSDHRGAQQMRVYQFKSGKLEIAQDWTKEPIIKPKT